MISVFFGKISALLKEKRNFSTKKNSQINIFGEVNTVPKLIMRKNLKVKLPVMNSSGLKTKQERRNCS